MCHLWEQRNVYSSYMATVKVNLYVYVHSEEYATIKRKVKNFNRQGRDIENGKK